MYKLLLVEDFASLSAEDETYFRHMLPIDRIERIDRMKNINDRKAMLVAWLMLRLLLKEHFNIDSFDTVYNKYGKPSIKNHSGVYFNISHCRTGCLCAVADQPIGIDIQEVRPFDWCVADYVCCSAEQDVLRSSNDPASEFICMWVVKESFLKMTGEGIGRGLKSVNTLKYKNSIPVIERNGTFIAVACPEMLGVNDLCID